jgi:hypothetical protein
VSITGLIIGFSAAATANIGPGLSLGD